MDCFFVPTQYYPVVPFPSLIHFAATELFMLSQGKKAGASGSQGAPLILVEMPA